MAIHVYQCRVCSDQFELMEPMDSPLMSPCFRCGQAAERVIAPTNAIFKGKGFFSTENRSGNYELGKYEQKTAKDAEDGKNWKAK